MQSLTIQLHDEIYQRLTDRAVAQQKTLEQFAADCLTAIIRLQVPTRFQKPALSEEAATEIGTKFVTAWGSRLLHLGKPAFDSKQSIWCIQLFVPNASEPLHEVGTIRIDAQTGEVLTRYGEVKAIFSEIRSKLGIQSFPKAQQDRLSYLLAQNRDGKLNSQQQQELDDLMEAADAQEIDNLKRLPNPISTQRGD